MIAGWQLKTPCGKGKYVTERSPTLQAALARRQEIEAKERELNADRDKELQQERDAAAAFMQRSNLHKLSHGGTPSQQLSRNADGTFVVADAPAPDTIKRKRKDHGWSKKKTSRMTDWRRAHADLVEARRLAELQKQYQPSLDALQLLLSGRPALEAEANRLGYAESKLFEMCLSLRNVTKHIVAGATKG
jgi:hypothetical protein